MSTSLRPRRLALLASLPVTALLVFGHLSVRSDDAPKAAATAVACTSPTGQYVSMIVRNPNGTTQRTPNIPWVQNENVALAMENARSINSGFSYATQYYCPYGQYVTTVNGFYEGGTYYWALLINGQFAKFGIETQPLKPGDVITWEVRSATPAEAKESDSHQLMLLLRHRETRLDALKPASDK